MRSDRFFLNSSDSNSPASIYEEYSRSKFLQEVCDHENVQCILFGTYRLEKTCFESEFLNNIGDKKLPILVLHGRKPLDEDDKDRSSDWVAQIPPDQQSWLSIWEVIPSFKCSDNSFNQTHGCHHPKYLLIFTDKGMHISISTSNLTNTVSVDGAWTQFFPKLLDDDESYDGKQTNDFGIVLEDFLTKESKNIRYNMENNIQINESRSRNILKWIESYTSISSISVGYNFNGAEVDLITTVPCRQPLPTLTEEEMKWLYNRNNIPFSLRKSDCCAKCKLENGRILPPESNVIQYGSFRVQSIIIEKEREFPRPLKGSDHLIAQPTSIGGLMNNQYIGSWLETLMPDEYWNKFPEKLRQDSWRLIWPSNSYMQDVKTNVTSSLLVRKTKTISKKDDGKENNEAISTFPVETIRLFRTGIVFLNPKIFALMEPDIQNIFHTYEPNCIPSLNLDWKKVPHIKTYTRLMQGIHPPADKFRNSHVVPHCICWKVAWSWLTSACLSKGAQGEEVAYSICSDCRHVRQGYREFRNFELGVLFRSTKTRQYFALNNACTVCTRAKPFQKITATRNECSSSSSGKLGHEKQEKLQYSSLAMVPKRYAPVQNITLPYPFHISKAKPFCDHRGKLVIEPYFHEDLQTKDQFVGSKLESTATITPKYRKFDVQIPAVNNDSLQGRMKTLPTPTSTTKRKLNDDDIESGDVSNTLTMKKCHTIGTFSIPASPSPSKPTINLPSSPDVNIRSEPSSTAIVDETSSPIISLRSRRKAQDEKFSKQMEDTKKFSDVVEISTDQQEKKALVIQEIASIPAYHNMIQSTSPPMMVQLSPDISFPSQCIPMKLKLSYAFRSVNKITKIMKTHVSSPSNCSSASSHSSKLHQRRINDENNISTSNSLHDEEMEMSEIAV